ncbi:hypothetical protein V8F06_001608 [Rhypophila decipiens]
MTGSVNDGVPTPTGPAIVQFTGERIAKPISFAIFWISLGFVSAWNLIFDGGKWYIATGLLISMMLTLPTITNVPCPSTWKGRLVDHLVVVVIIITIGSAGGCRLGR